MFMRDHGQGERRRRWPALVAVVLAPLLVAGGFIWATWHSGDRLHRVDAAIVNLDQPVTVNGQTVPLGRQLTAGLVRGSADHPDLNVTWVLSNTSDAAAGLDSGRYAAVVTIPKGFSAAATSTADPDSARQATIDIQTSKITAIADAPLTTAISTAAVQAMNTTLTKTYLDNLYIGFNQIHDQFGTVADAAGRLADGQHKLATGAQQSADGASSFAKGLHTLDAGAKKLDANSSTITTGGTQIAQGMQQLARQTKDLPRQAKAMAGGVRQVAGGADDLATGAEKLSNGAGRLATGLDTVDTSVSTYTRGVGQAATGAKQVSTGLGTFAGSVDDYRDGVSAYHTAMVGIRDHGLTSNGEAVCPPEITDSAPPTMRDQLCAAFTAGTKAAGAAAVQGLDGSAQQPGLATGADRLATAATGLSTGAKQVATGLGTLDKNGAKLAKGIGAMADAADQLSTGASNLSKGATTLSTGADQAATGVETFAKSAPALSKGISRASSGVSTYVAGVASYTAGVSKLAGGIATSATAADKLAAGLDTLANGVDKSATGARQLADGLAKGQDKIPTYDHSQRQHLATAVANPVTATAASTSVAEAADLPGIAATTLLIMAALLLGALISYQVVRATPPDLLTSSRSTMAVLTRGLAPAALVAAVQAVVLTALGAAVLHLSLPTPLGVGAVSLLGGLVCVALVHALTIWFGNVGRLVGLAVLVVAAAGELTSAAPAFFETVRPFLPTTPLLDGLRALITGGSDLPVQVLLLGLWLVVAVVAAFVGLARGRVVTPRRLAQLVRAG